MPVMHLDTMKASTGMPGKGKWENKIDEIAFCPSRLYQEYYNQMSTGLWTKSP
jgi:hypothetical protein